MDFTDKDFANMFYDAMAADDFLRKENPHMRVQMLGASIGANVALRYQEMNTLDSIILLSPGLNYHGLKTEDANLGNIATPALYLCSQGDQSAADTIHLFESSSLTEENKKLINYLGDKHGIFFVDDNPQAVDDVVAWLKERSGQPEIS